MVKLLTGLNSFFIANDKESIAVESYAIEIESAFQDNHKEFELDSVDVNPRYIKFNLELVVDGAEDLNNGKVYLTTGLHKINIYTSDTSNELLYTNILLVEYTESGEFKYLTEDDNTFVY
jgi:hypothetical protein